MHRPLLGIAVLAALAIPLALPEAAATRGVDVTGHSSQGGSWCERF